MEVFLSHNPPGVRCFWSAGGCPAAVGWEGTTSLLVGLPSCGFSGSSLPASDRGPTWARPAGACGPGAMHTHTGAPRNSSLAVCPGVVSSEQSLAWAINSCHVLATLQEGQGTASLLPHSPVNTSLLLGARLSCTREWTVSLGFRSFWKHTARGIRLHKPKVYLWTQGSRWKTPQWDLTCNQARQVAAMSNLT